MKPQGQAIKEMDELGAFAFVPPVVCSVGSGVSFIL
jgi:hypothetical protein